MGSAACNDDGLLSTPKKRGPKKPHAGMFKRGDDPKRNIHGCYGKEKRTFRELCIQDATKQIDYWMCLRDDTSAPHSMRHKANEALASYGQGKPVTESQMTSLKITADFKDLPQMNRTDLLHMASNEIIEGESISESI